MNIRRIVSLAPSNTEIVFALDAQDKLVGVTEFCNYPPEAKLIEKNRRLFYARYKKIVSLFPDLVLATDFHSKTVTPELKARGIPTYAVEAKTILDAPLAISFVGKVIGCQKEAARLAKEIQEKIERICRRNEVSDTRPKICYICSHDPLCIAQKSCAVNKLIEIAGGVNIMQDIVLDNVKNLRETITRIDPQVIITYKGHRETTDLFSYVMNDPFFKQTRAYSNKRIYQIDSELICRPGPRAGEGLKTLAKFIHPEIFIED